MFPRLQQPSTLSQSSSKTIVKTNYNSNTQRMLLKTIKPLLQQNVQNTELTIHPTYDRRRVLVRPQISETNSIQTIKGLNRQIIQNQYLDSRLNEVRSIMMMNDDQYIVPTQLTTQEVSQYDLNKNITFKLSALCYSHKARQVDQIIPCTVSIQAKELQKELPKVGVDLICLIDVSSSMEGEKLILVKKTLKLLLEFLSPNDRLCIVTFNDQPQRLGPLRCVNKQTKAELRQMIDGLEAGGGTVISLAMVTGFEQLNQRRYINNVSAIFLLSDGCDDRTSSIQLQQYLAGCNQTFTIHSFGFGQDHDAELMTSICQLKNGSFYFVNDITMLNEFFIDALGGLVSVVADDIKIQVQGVCKEIKIRKVYGEMWNKQKYNQSYSITLQQLSAGHRKDYVFELEFPAKLHFDENNRKQVIVKAQLQLRSPSSNLKITKSNELVLDFYNADEQVAIQQKDYDLAAQYYRVKAVQAIKQANQLCQQGQHNLASQNLQKLIDDIKASKRTAALAQATLTDLEQAKQATNPDK